MLLHSFYCFDYVRRLPLKYITRLLIKAKYKENDNLLKQRWMLHYQDSMPYEEFKNTLMVGVNSSDKTDEETLMDVKDIINTFNEGVKQWQQG